MLGGLCESRFDGYSDSARCDIRIDWIRAAGVRARQNQA